MKTVAEVTGVSRSDLIDRMRELAAGLKPPNHKRVYRVMKVHGLLLDCHAGGVERRHDGRIAVDARNRRWCSDGFEIGCDNGERVRVAFALDCYDREAMVVHLPDRAPRRRSASASTSSPSRPAKRSAREPGCHAVCAVRG